MTGETVTEKTLVERLRDHDWQNGRQADADCARAGEEIERLERELAEAKLAISEGKELESSLASDMVALVERVEELMGDVEVHRRYAELATKALQVASEAFDRLDRLADSLQSHEVAAWGGKDVRAALAKAPKTFDEIRTMVPGSEGKRYPGCPVTEPGAKCDTCEASCEGPWLSFPLNADALPARFCPKCKASGDQVGEAGSECWTKDCDGVVASRTVARRENAIGPMDYEKVLEAFRHYLDTRPAGYTQATGCRSSNPGGSWFDAFAAGAQWRNLDVHSQSTMKEPSRG